MGDGCGGGCGCGCGDGGSAGRSRGGARLAAVFLLMAVLAGAAIFATTRQGAKDGVRITRAAQPAGTPAPAEAPAPAPARAAAPDDHRFGRREAKPRTDGAIRLADYNVENLFDEVDDPAYSGRDEDIDDAKPLSERRALAAAIRAIDADVLAVEEVESKAALTWFVDEQLSDMGYRYIESIDAGDSRGIEQAVLSRFPILDARVWPGEALGGIHPEKWGNGKNWEAGKPIAFHRSPLRVTVHVPGATQGAGGDSAGYDLTLFVVHHKSGGPGNYWREKEAARIVEKAGEVIAADPAANIAILGDFNCQAGEPPYQAYIAAGFTSVLAEAAASAGAGGRPGPEWTTHESGRTLDHILVNANLHEEIVPGSVFVYGTPARPAGSDWRTTPPPPGFASDHYPLVVDLIPKD